jgi:GTP-binding protein Era
MTDKSGTGKSGTGKSGTGKSGTGKPGTGDERRLTPGERNELRRQERRAARRAETESGRGSSSGSSGGKRSGAPGGAQATGRSGAPAGRPGGAEAVGRFGAGTAGREGGAQSAGRAGGARSGARTHHSGGGPRDDRTGGAGPRRARGGPAENAGRPESASAAPTRTSKMPEGTAQKAHRDAEAKSQRDAEAKSQRHAKAKSHRHAEAARSDATDVYRAGFACFVGRPNAGKSTLTNAIVGQKITITSNKPQTTRHVIRGILHREDAQLVLVDTPGLHRPRTLLGERLNDLVRGVWSEVDVIGVCFPADEPVGRGDRFISAEMAELKATVVAVVTKVDLVDSRRLAEHLLAVSQLHDFAEVVPVSAVSGHQLQNLVDVMIKYLPESPQLYPDDVLTDEPEQVLIAELIREAALEGVRDELPHSIAVLVEEMIVEGALTKIYADLYVERDSQKSIVIGSRGARLKEVGSRARAEIEQLLGGRVYLDLHVRVAKEWQRDPRQLRKLGF